MGETDFKGIYSEPLLEQGDGSDLHLPRKASFAERYFRALVALLSLSLLTNVFLFTVKHREIKDGHSLYAGLPMDMDVTFEWASEYANPNLTEAGKLWEAIDFDVGMVALPNEWAEKKELPQAQPFPWDHDQGLYVLNGYHALHCLKNIHRSIREYDAGAKQSLSTMHITHCLDALRSDIICQADDTPRYTTITKSPESAVGQVRKCRDWKKLEEWAKERTSCYNYISHKADFINQFKRFQFCPKDSPYWPVVREHFGKPDTWFGDDYDEEIEGARTHMH